MSTHTDDRASVAAKLQEENARLRAQLAKLRKALVACIEALSWMGGER